MKIYPVAEHLAQDSVKEAVRMFVPDVQEDVLQRVLRVALVGAAVVQAVLEAVSEDVILMLAREDVQVHVLVHVRDIADCIVLVKIETHIRNK